MVWPVFKTATEAPLASPVGSIPTRSRHLRRAPVAWRESKVGHALTAVIAFGLVFAGPAAAQDTTRVSPSVIQIEQQGGAPRADSGRVYPKPPLSPMGAFFRSLLIPGWSQAKLGRRLTGGLFIVWEGVSLGMMLKTTHELNYLEAVGDSLQIEDKKAQQQDWITMLAFNHLFSALEGYVSAHLWDFPDDVKIRAVPTRGGKAVGVTVPFRLP